MTEQRDRIGKYKVSKELGRGTMAAVYLARDPSLEREVAIKVMLQSIESDEALRQRFLVEAKAVARIPPHPNIVPVHDLGRDADGSPYIVMEYIRGSDLEWRIENDPPTFSQKLEIVADVLSGLAEAHRHDIVHRDVKPANILIADGGRAKVSDFGVARWADSRTHTGTMLGTPYYMSPEHIRSDGSIDGRADIWSVGVILYRLLTGSLPFQGDHFEAILYQVLKAEPAVMVMADGRHIPELQRIVVTALQKDRTRRFRDAEEMERCVRAFADKSEGVVAPDTMFGEVRPETTGVRPQPPKPPPPLTWRERVSNSVAESPSRTAGSEPTKRRSRGSKLGDCPRVPRARSDWSESQGPSACLRRSSEVERGRL